MTQDRIPINRCLNKEQKLYGLKVTGLVIAFILGIVVLIKFNFTFAIFGSVLGYLAGAGISKHWHTGYIQRWLYWNLPTQILANTKRLPKSCNRRFL